MDIISVRPCLKVHNIEVQFGVCIILKPNLDVGKIAKSLKIRGAGLGLSQAGPNRATSVFVGRIMACLFQFFLSLFSTELFVTFVN
jgi:hypothetical protein